jgi:hypothetical protein
MKLDSDGPCVVIGRGFAVCVGHWQRHSKINLLVNEKLNVRRDDLIDNCFDK